MRLVGVRELKYYNDFDWRKISSLFHNFNFFIFFHILGSGQVSPNDRSQIRGWRAERQNHKTGGKYFIFVNFLVKFCCLGHCQPSLTRKWSSKIQCKPWINKVRGKIWSHRSNLFKTFLFSQDTVTHLSRENEVLRANVNPDVLASLLGNRSILGGLPPDPNSHPALQPPNQH